MLLYSILERHPQLRGTLFDQPSVISKVEHRFEDRCELVGGDFFDSVPVGGDVYLLKMILHDWGDADCAKILSACRAAMSPGSKLLLLEATIAEGDEEQFMRIYLDLLMMVMFGGKERTIADLSGLLEPAGFQLERAIPTRSFITVIEAMAV